MEGPAKRLPAASPMIMKPNWLMVEYAQTRLMSRLTMAMVDARSMEKVPIARNVVLASGEWLKKGNRRANRYTPAATMVAEWSRALTGVGPSMASGSQVMSGNWALLPTMPPKISKAARVRRPGIHAGQLPRLFISRISRFPRWSSTSSRPMKNAHVAQPGHDKGLLPRLGGTELLVPETDEQIRREPDQFPEDVELEHGRGDGQGHHRPGEKRLKRIVTGEPGVAGHVAQGVDLDQKADGGHQGTA